MATVGDAQARLGVEQAEQASTIAAAALRRGLPVHAVTIALATALQESDLRNLGQVDAFYDALIAVDGYQTMGVAEAAQATQGEGPKPYAEHEAAARTLATALMGRSPAAFTCSVRPDSLDREAPGRRGLTPRAAKTLSAVETAFGGQRVGGFDPAGVTSGHMRGSAHYSGRAVDLFHRPVSAANRRAGWASAQWLVANAERLEVATVIYDGKIWTARRSALGWRDYTPPNGNTSNPTLMHRDHVHFDVR